MAVGRRSVAGAAAVALLFIVTVTRGLGNPLTNPDSLWKIVHGNCVPRQEARGDPGECRLVDLAARYAVLKDLRGNTRFLLLPTDRISGIESPLLLQPGAVNYWRAAWEARRYVEERAGRKLSRDMTGLAINSRRRSSFDVGRVGIAMTGRRPCDTCVGPAARDVLMRLTIRSVRRAASGYRCGASVWLFGTGTP